MPLMTNQASRLFGGNAIRQPVPVLGAELLTNGNFSAWSGDNPTGWTIFGTETGAAYVTESAGRARIVSAGDTMGILQRPFVAGTWYALSIDVVSITGALRVIESGTATPLAADLAAAGTRNIVARGNGTGSLLIYRWTTPVDAIIDNVSLKPITLASMFLTRDYTTHATTKARATVIAGTRAGVVANLDSATSPANFVIASHDGTTARLTKCVGGTYTELISTTVAYSAGAFVEIRRLAGTNTYQLWYNGSQVGTNQTISDAGIVSNTLHGLFNTYASNALSDFSCVAS